MPVIREFEPNDVRFFTSLKGKGGYFTEGIFIAEGPKIVPIMLESALQMHSGFMTEAFYKRFKHLIDTRDDFPLYVAPKERMEEIVGYSLHQGVMLAVHIPIAPSIEDAVQSWKSPFFAIALDSIADAENMGAIIRNAAAFGCDAILLDSQSCNPYLRRSVRVSMGTIAHVRCIQVEDLALTLATIREQTGAQILGATLSDRARSIQSFDLTRPTIIVLGAEGTGISPSVINALDGEAIIPIEQGIDSLNVAIASGIAMYELRRQRASA